MKSIFRIVYFLIIVVLVGCHSKHSQSDSQKTLKSKEDIKPLKGISSINNPDSMAEKLTYNQLYSEGETRREYFTKLVSDSSTTQRIFSEKAGKDSLSITLYYQKNRIISIVYRITSLPQNEKIYNSVFYFDENNYCVSNSIKNKTAPTYDYLMYWESLIMCDGKYNKIDLNFSQKQKIIQSVKASLDSIMQHFPEFEYSFNWK